jgi:hypothetical protein
MGLKELYESGDARFPYVNTVVAQQEETAGARPGVNFFDGTPRTRTLAPDQFQDEFQRNAAGAFKYGASGRGGKVPGQDVSTDGLGGLSRWTGNALNIAFNDASSAPSLASIYNRYKGFKQGATWNAAPSFHRWRPDSDFKESLTDDQLTKTRVTGAASGPAPAGLNG